MANELKIVVRFDTGQARTNADALRKPIQGIKQDLDALAKTQAVAQTSMQQTTRVSANAATTLQALNFTVRDSPYFFRDFSLGVLAVGNNLNPLIDGLIRMNTEAKAANSTLGRELLNSLKGPAGLVFGFSILVTVLQAVTFALAKTKSEAEAQKQSINDLVKEYKDFSDIVRALNLNMASMSLDEISLAFDRAKQKIQDLNREAKYGFFGQLWQGLTFKPLTDFFNIDNELIKSIQTPPYGMAGISKDEKGLEDAKLLIELTKKYAAELTKVLTTPLNLGRTSERELKRYLALIDGQLADWGKDIKEKKLTIGDQMKGDFVEIGTFERSKLEALKKQISDYLSPKAKGEDPLMLSFWGDLEDQRKYVEKFDKILSDSILEEAEERQDKEKTLLKTKQEYEQKIKEWKVELIEDEYEYKIAKLKLTYDEEARMILANKRLGSMTAEQAEEALQARKELLDYAISKVKVKSPTEKEKKLAEEAKRLNISVEQLKENLSEADGWATRVGNTLFNAFTQADMTVQRFLQSLLAVVAQLLLIEGLKFVFSGGVSGIFGTLGFEKGGIVPKAEGGYIIPGTSYRGDKVPILANSGEMILNQMQQAKLFSIINNGVGNIAVLKQLEIMNANMALLTPTVVINADTDAVKFTRREISPSQKKLRRGNIRV